MFRLFPTKHKSLTAFTGGSGHGHGTKAVFCAVQNVLHNAVHNWAVFYASGGLMSRDESAKSTQMGTLYKMIFSKALTHFAFQVELRPICTAPCLQQIPRVVLVVQSPLL